MYVDIRDAIFEKNVIFAWKRTPELLFCRKVTILDRF